MPEKPSVLTDDQLPQAIQHAIKLTVAKESRAADLKDDRVDLKYLRDCITLTLEAKGSDGFRDIQFPVTYGNRTRQGPWKVELVEQRYAPKFANESAWLEAFMPAMGKLGVPEAACQEFLTWMWHATHDRTQSRHVLKIAEGRARNLQPWK